MTLVVIALIIAGLVCIMHDMTEAGKIVNITTLPWCEECHYWHTTTQECEYNS